MPVLLGIIVCYSYWIYVFLITAIITFWTSKCFFNMHSYNVSLRQFCMQWFASGYLVRLLADFMRVIVKGGDSLWFVFVLQLIAMRPRLLHSLVLGLMCLSLVAYSSYYTSATLPQKTVQIYGESPKPTESSCLISCRSVAISDFCCGSQPPMNGSSDCLTKGEAVQRCRLYKT